ncbi:hypothetical protein EJ04DRAFT_514681 [Polyplosphaeria fusca]|uniref:Reverse transcriptase domain-containing protein n=1 Tax=Polyplosphaeria fusca TaxID=682080 RepID=A0A9P4QUU5_9PLEO|nr:hypothetical protein EJ04DRAFT_514681 [Polyplosphaeria fusca]
MSSPGLSTLHHVTTRKLNKLDAHRDKFEADKTAILARVAAAQDPASKVEALLAGFELHSIKPKQSELHLSTLERFVHQSKHDPSVSPALFRDWHSKLEHELDAVSAKYEYAALFGKLVIEWIKYPNPGTGNLPVASDSDSETSDSFDQVGRKEMHEQREEWESCTFTERKVDQSKIEDYLNDIFGTTLQAKKIKNSPLQNLRESMKGVMDFKSDLQTPKRKDMLFGGKEGRFTVDKLRSCIRGVIQSDLLAGQKREALIDLENQPAVLKELVDVLNMDLEDLDKWGWDPSPVPLHMRRQLNGKYRVFMDEETHQAILLHFVGKIWAVAMKQAFKAFYHSGAWLQTPYRSMSKKARQRREYFVPGETRVSSSIRNRRRGIYQEEYFMTQLPDDPFADYRDYAAEDQDASSSTTKSPLATKQSMLRLVTAELLVNTKVYGEFLVLQSDFKWFGPSLPHDTIFAVLKFFGVPGKWLRFFKKFLEAPVVFAQDGADAQAHMRKCGIPMSHVLSDALSEAVLFCLDFAVNRRTGGANIHRFHDDLWFWGQESTCIKAWDAIQEFSKVMGLQLNEEKTGTALIVSTKDKARTLPPALPQGKVKWGFLILDSETGRWVIDRKQVDEHIEELRHQLGACRSIMAWVQAWNSYVSRFFLSNFGQPAFCFGRQHNDAIIETFSHIQRSLFVDVGSASVTEYLRNVMRERFGMDGSVPDAFFYFPVELGGLGLRNPFIQAFATHKQNFKDPVRRIDRAFEEEQEEYDCLKERWDAGHLPATHMKRAPVARDDARTDTDSEPDEPFISFEEYVRYREETSSFVCRAYEKLMECPVEECIDTSIDFANNVRAFLKTSPATESYWLWTCTLYGGEVKDRFGGDGLQLGERDLLPIGLVDVLNGEKVRWDG